MQASIITISYNSVDTIEDTIKSVLRQRYSDIEYIIIDGGSQDGTLDIVEKYSDSISKIISEPDKGLYDAMNKGVSVASGDIIGILNSDDLYADDDVIQEVVSSFEEGVQAVYGDLKYVDRENISKVRRTWIAGAYEAGMFKKGWMPPHPTFFVRRELYTHLGRYDLRFKTSADYELMLRFIHKHGINIVYLPKFLTLMRAGGQSNVSISNRLKANKEDRLAWKINGLNPGTLTSVRKPLSKVTQFFKK